MHKAHDTKRSLAYRMTSLAAVLAAFGGVAGAAMARQDAWARWLGLELSQTASIAAGAALGAALGVLAARFGGGGRGKYWESSVDDGSSDGD